MAVGGKYDDMVNYASDLGVALSGKGDFSEKKRIAESKAKAESYIKESESRLAAPKETPKETPKKRGEDISIGGTLEKVKARNKMLSDL